ncbi:HD domain-containing protein [Paenibacillus sp. EC2-1]|uniref:HD domain-containing protein n=1 Tax=Paenibacillus sp. EC2-1 TaxID=3388665 RepID=UPI003BEF1B99
MRKFKDVIHGTINIFDEDIYGLILTKPFQRLKQLKQQGNTFYKLNGAVHDRYYHSLGVYENMRKLIKNLKSNDAIDITLYEEKAALVSALLHDLGHGPFSHCFENITGIYHEKWSLKIVEECSDIKNILQRTPGLIDDVLSIIARTDSKPLIQELLFSQIGVDKLDYHLRDLYYSGINCESYNLNKLINGLRTHNDLLVITPEIIQEVEKLVTIKRRLFEEGFGHPDVMGKDVLLKLLFNRANVLFSQNKLVRISAPLLPLIEGGMWPINDYLSLTDQTIVDLVEEWKENDDSLLSNLCKKYLLQDSIGISWIELNEWRKNTVYTITEVVTQELKYGFYEGGIKVLQSNELADIEELSNIVRKYKHEEVKSYLYYLQ